MHIQYFLYSLSSTNHLRVGSHHLEKLVIPQPCRRSPPLPLPLPFQSSFTRSFTSYPLALHSLLLDRLIQPVFPKSDRQAGSPSWRATAVPQHRVQKYSTPILSPHLAQPSTLYPLPDPPLLVFHRTHNEIQPDLVQRFMQAATSPSPVPSRTQPPPPSPPQTDWSVKDSSVGPHRARPLSQPNPSSEKKVSCLECRASKVKCSGGPRCQRCQRLGRTCLFQQHKRGRKSDNSKIQNLQNTVNSLTRALEEFSGHKILPPVNPKHDTSHLASGRIGSEPYRPRPTTLAWSGSSEKPALPGALPSPSLRFHSSHSSPIVSAPPATDPDEPDNLGLPTLSNPLKLLAHASDSARDRIDRPQTDENTGCEDAENVQAGNDFGQVGTAQVTGTSSPPSQRCGPGRGRAYFFGGLFSPKFDNLEEIDPISCGIITEAEARKLFRVFVERLNSPLTLLDPHLHTFEYVRRHSAMLLTITCWIAAQHSYDGARPAQLLETHFKKVLLPTVLLEGYRSAEIAQAFIVAGSYHPPTSTLSQDRAWSYLGYAIRMAAELDMNSKIVKIPADRVDDESLVRRIRNRERTWLNLWLYETSISQHMGRRATLGTDPVVLCCGRWHTAPFALPEDKAIVAIVQLRLLLMRDVELFDTFVTMDTGQHSAMQLELFRKTCARDLDSWLATWADEPDSDRQPQTPRMRKARLYYWYSRLILSSIPLKWSDLPFSVLEPVYADAYASAMAYLALFMESLVPTGLPWSHNSTVVTPTYCAIFALKIMALPEAEALNIDEEYTFNMVDQLAKALEEAGKITPHRYGAAGSYAPYLQTVLNTARKRQKMRIRAAGGQDKSLSAPASQEARSKLAPTSSLHFQAGPSGVQSLVPTASKDPLSDTFYDALAQGDNVILDCFLGESLFNDMCFQIGDDAFL
ncbi:hypothetical protein IE53DRAFT_377774 [Violaceomyces palustris]|uniref:Uncharacterized protein n=1 Tax=Violaceomyces palustris TaxID=1673888 RepID=A0ACD0P4C2_9BASI|nr:hypothetical protein IE53DRAFT_377774 [Violaceomyces palustris]